MTSLPVGGSGRLWPSSVQRDHRGPRVPGDGRAGRWRPTRLLRGASRCDGASPRGLGRGCSCRRRPHTRRPGAPAPTPRLSQGPCAPPRPDTFISSSISDIFRSKARRSCGHKGAAEHRVGLGGGRRQPPRHRHRHRGERAPTSRDAAAGARPGPAAGRGTLTAATAPSSPGGAPGRRGPAACRAGEPRGTDPTLPACVTAAQGTDREPRAAHTRGGRSTSHPRATSELEVLSKPGGSPKERHVPETSRCRPRQHGARSCSDRRCWAAFQALRPVSTSV